MAHRDSLLRLAALFSALLSYTSAWSKPLQIIHTADLHSHFDHAEDPTRGSYAAVKATIDKLRLQASEQGIETLVVDAGDFSEGTQYFLAGRGRYSWRMMNAMGYDAVTIGNHDWLMGAHALNEIIGESRPNFHFLGANFIFGGENKNLTRYMRPYAEFIRNGLRIAVLGLATEELVYDWRIDDGFVSPSVWEAADRVPALRMQADYVIALTHLGLNADTHLIKRTSGIDLVLGGHSHSTLFEPAYATAPDGKKVPISHTGKHGEYVGDILVDISEGKPLQILRYRLVPVEATGPRDSAIDEIKKKAEESLDLEFGADWLHETIGFSQIPMEKPNTGPTAWSDIVDTGMKEAGKAEVSLNLPEFYGNSEVSGAVTREKLFAFYPRVFDINHRYGWTVWTARTFGWMLKLLVTQAVQRGFVITGSGITYDRIEKNGSISVKNIRINGKPIHPWANYKIAVPEGIGRGSIKITDLLQVALRNLHDTRIPIWAAAEARLKEIGGVVKKPESASRAENPQSGDGDDD